MRIVLNKIIKKIGLEKEMEKVWTNLQKGIPKGSQNEEKTYKIAMAKFEAFRSRPFDITGPRGRLAAPPESQAGGTEGGKPKALSQPVNPGGVGGYARMFFFINML